MRLAKLIIPKIIKRLHCSHLALPVLFFLISQPIFSQDNSPYSRFGIGDLVPPTSITSRSMGGIAAGYTDYLTINFNNPASYYIFQTGPQGKNKKISSGRTIFDVGMNLESRTLQQSNPTGKFTASNALFSYVQLGIPLKKNWGLSFGLRPVSRISYKIIREEKLVDPISGLPIENSSTRFEGDGGSYMPTVGTGFTIFKKNTGKLVEQNLSVGVNVGYYFGKKDYSSKRTLINDTVEYFQGNYETKTSFNNIYFSAGTQYRVPLQHNFLLTMGLYGSWGQKLNASQDRIRETFVYDPSFGDIRLDSVSDIKNISGKILLPANYTIGFVLQKIPGTPKDGSWLVGIDFSRQNWANYRFYGQMDSLRNKWELRLGTQFNPAPHQNFLSNIAYRAGLFFGPDYVQVGHQLTQLGFSLGMGLPIKNQNRLTPYQASIINLSFEFIKRGNNDNLLKENLYRLSLGFSLSDFWFIKRKYD